MDASECEADPHCSQCNRWMSADQTRHFSDESKARKCCVSSAAQSSRGHELRKSGVRATALILRSLMIPREILARWTPFCQSASPWRDPAREAKMQAARIPAGRFIRSTLLAFLRNLCAARGSSLRGRCRFRVTPSPADYSATRSPEPPISLGKSFIFGKPSLMRSFVS